MLKRPIKNVILANEYRSLGGAISVDSAGQRIDFFLTSHFPFYSRAGWQKRIREGCLIVNEESVRPSYRLKDGDQFQLFHPHVQEPEVDDGIYPIWKNGGVMAVYKPGNLPMHEGGPYRKNTFSHLLREMLGSEWSSVHRLDRETSGLVLCGATTKIRHELSRSLASREVEKQYLAIVNGIPETNFWIENGSIGDLKESAIRIKKWVVTDGAPAETWFDLMESKHKYSLIKARPKTGRTNQIRIHAAFKNLPIVGDKLYHPDESTFIEYFENQGTTANVLGKAGFHRLCLHAANLRFRHPETRNTCEISAPLPNDMQAFWDSLD